MHFKLSLSEVFSVLVWVFFGGGSLYLFYAFESFLTTGDSLDKSEQLVVVFFWQCFQKWFVIAFFLKPRENDWSKVTQLTLFLPLTALLSPFCPQAALDPPH